MRSVAMFFLRSIPWTLAFLGGGSVLVELCTTRSVLNSVLAAIIGSIAWGIGYWRRTPRPDLVAISWSMVGFGMVVALCSVDSWALAALLYVVGAVVQVCVLPLGRIAAGLPLALIGRVAS